MILNVDPGGWGAETARPASASTEPSRGRTTATPPSLPPERRGGGALQPGPDRGVDRAPAAALDRGDDAVAEAQLRAGPAGQALVVQALEAGAAVAARRRAPGDGRRRRVGGQQPAVGAQHLRRASGACSTTRRTCSPARRPGRRRCGAHAIRAAPSSSCTGSTIVPRSVPKIRVGMATGQREAPVALLGDAAHAHALAPSPRSRPNVRGVRTAPADRLRGCACRA